MVRLAAIGLCVFASGGSLAIPPPEAGQVQRPVGHRISVDVTGAPEGETAKRLASAVKKELERDPRFSLSHPGQRGAVNICLPANVGWERSLGWTEISYQARLNSVSGRSRVVTGKCWNWNLAVCAKQIAEATVNFVTVEPSRS